MAGQYSARPGNPQPLPGLGAEESRVCRDTQEDRPVQQASRAFMNHHPNPALWLQGRTVCIRHHLSPRGPGRRPLPRGLGAHSVPRVPDPGGPAPRRQRPRLGAHHLLRCPAPGCRRALPGARKAGIRCYHNKLNCSQQGPGK